MRYILLFFMLVSNIAAKPNIIVFVADDLGYGDLGCYGNGSVNTPNIDCIARDGVKMTQHLSASSTCTPSRSALLTGRYPIRTGMAAPGTMRVIIWPYTTCGLPSSEITFAEQAKAAGYTNAFIGGKTHGAPEGPMRIPCFVKWPGVLPRNTVTDEPTTYGYVSMISAAAGVSVPDDRQIDDRDIRPLLKGETTVSPHEFMFHYCGNKLHAARYRTRQGSTTWKLVTHLPAYIPGRNICHFACMCNKAVTLATPELYDITSDPGETTPIDSNSQLYRDISAIILEGINNHKNSIVPVESQFTLERLRPRPWWQPCCNGTFPFNCHCVDPKYPD